MKKNLKLLALIFMLSNIFFVFNTKAFGYPRDNFQKMEEFVHNRDLVRNLRQEPYRPQFNLQEENDLFLNELQRPGSEYNTKACHVCISEGIRCPKSCSLSTTHSSIEYLNFLHDYSGAPSYNNYYSDEPNYNYNYSSYWPY